MQVSTTPMLWDSARGVLRTLLQLALLCGLLLTQVDCNEPCNHPNSLAFRCCKDVDCSGRRCDAPDGKCICRDGLCMWANPDPRCKNDADCKPGEICNLIGKCEKGAGCQSNDSCSDGKICCDSGNGKGQECNFAKCLIHEDCRIGGKNTCVAPIACRGAAQAACIVGVCKCVDPCGGVDCGKDKCCSKDTNKCVDNPTPCPDLQCAPGSLPPAASRYTVDPKTCEVTGPSCECHAAEETFEKSDAGEVSSPEKGHASEEVTSEKSDADASAPEP